MMPTFTLVRPLELALELSRLQPDVGHRTSASDSAIAATPLARRTMSDMSGSFVAVSCGTARAALTGRGSDPTAVGQLVRLPGLLQQAHERLHFRRREVAELRRVALLNLLGQIVEQSDPGVRDPEHDDAAVVGRALTDDQTPVVQPVHQPGDVRRARDEP